MKIADQTKLGHMKNKESLTCGVLTQSFLTTTVVRRYWSDWKRCWTGQWTWEVILHSKTLTHGNTGIFRDSETEARVPIHTQILPAKQSYCKRANSFRTWQQKPGVKTPVLVLDSNTHSCLTIKFVCPLEKNVIFCSGPLSAMFLNAGVMLKEYFHYVASLYWQDIFNMK